MYELIATIILIGSLIGMGTILFRKIPVLIEMPSQLKEPIFLLRLKEIIKKKNLLSFIGGEKFLEKLLHRVRILCFKVENKTSNLLEKLQQHSQGQRDNPADNYWQELKKTKKHASPRHHQAPEKSLQGASRRSK